MRRIMRLLACVFTAISFAALLLVVCVWLRSYAISDFISVDSGGNDAGMRLHFTQIWSSRGRFAVSHMRHAPHDVPQIPPERRSLYAHDVLGSISHPLERELRSKEIVQCLRTAWLGFGFQHAIDEEMWKGPSGFVGEGPVTAITLALPYWSLAAVLAIAPAIWIGRRIRWTWAVPAFRFRRSMLALHNRFAWKAIRVASLLILALFALLVVRMQWASWSFSSTQGHVANVPGDGFWSASHSFEGWAMSFYREGILFSRYAPDSPLPPPWEEKPRRSYSFHSGGTKSLRDGKASADEFGIRVLGFQISKQGELWDRGVDRELLPGEVGPPKPLPRVATTEWIVSVQYWMIALLVIPLPALQLLGWHKGRRASHRRKCGLCVACGYDLRASVGRCPECGLEPLHATGKSGG